MQQAAQAIHRAAASADLAAMGRGIADLEREFQRAREAMAVMAGGPEA